MASNICRLAVYCGSAEPADASYVEAARSVGETLAKRGIGIVYGGGKVGLMGAVADSALAAGGEVIGVIPEALKERELAHRGCTQLHIVKTMHARKAMFTDLSDGFLTLPGGVGTMDEFWEAMSWAQLGYHDNPVGLLNVAGFFDPLVALNRAMVDAGFVRPIHADILVVADSLDALLGKMDAYQPHRPILSMRADEL